MTVARTSDTQVKLLPPWARKLLAVTFQYMQPDDDLRISWYEFQRRSNFDKFDREKIREAAVKDGLVEYRHSRPHVTQKGVEWARREQAK